MIEIKNLTKTFDKLTAIDNLSLDIYDGSVLGLVGSNGSGKSTLLRTLAGVYTPDSGEIKISGVNILENSFIKGECFFIPDFPFFYNNSTINNSAFLYRRIYPNWSEDEFKRLCQIFPIDPKAKIINMSKGMQRQASLILALSTCPKYLFLDEIFDGLDPVMRFALKKFLLKMFQKEICQSSSLHTTCVSLRIFVTVFVFCTSASLLYNVTLTVCVRNTEKYRLRFLSHRWKTTCLKTSMW